MPLVSSWISGGNDYGGCLGAGNGWSNDSTSSDHHQFTDTPEPSSQHWYNDLNIGVFSPNSATGYQ